MKKQILSIAIFLMLSITSVSAGTSDQENHLPPTSMGMVIYSNDVETVWNALRLANHAKNQGDTVQVFLLAKGVELDKMVEVNKDLEEQVNAFLEKGGTILGCGTCLRSRKNNEPQICTFSSMADLYSIVRKNKIVLTF